MKRRTFFRKSLLCSGAVFAVPYLCDLRAQSPNDRIGVGIVGAGGMGTGDAKKAAQFAEIVAVADADTRHGERMKSLFEEKPVVYQDYRKLLENKDVDVVIQATPDHWHTKINIDAARAGKDVYGEKPFSLTVHEGQQLCKVLKETGRIFQTGTQQRSELKFQTAVELVRNGRIGKLRRVLVILPYFNTRGRSLSAAGSTVATRLGSVSRPGSGSTLRSAADAHRLPLVVRIRRRHRYRLGKSSYGHRPLGNGR